MYKSAERKNMGKPEDEFEPSRQQKNQSAVQEAQVLIGKRANTGSIQVSSNESQQQNILTAKSNSKKVAT